MTSHIKLYGSKSTRFETIKEAMSERLGYEPSNPEVVGILMANYDLKVIGVNQLGPNARASKKQGRR